MRRISGIKPMSHMRSASSSTKILMCDRSMCLSPTRSSNLPGQAMTMLTPLRNLETCEFLLTPPYMAMLRKPVPLPRLTLVR